MVCIAYECFLFCYLDPRSLILCPKSMGGHHKIQEFPENSLLNCVFMDMTLKVVPNSTKFKSHWSLCVLCLVTGDISSLICFVLLFNVHLLKTGPVPCLVLSYIFFHLIPIQPKESSVTSSSFDPGDTKFTVVKGLVKDLTTNKCQNCVVVGPPSPLESGAWSSRELSTEGQA